MLECVFSVWKGWLFINKLATLQIVQYTLEFSLRTAGQPPDKRERKLATNNGQRLQQCLLISRQPVNTRGQEHLDSGWDFYLVERLFGRQLSIPCNHPLFEQGLHHLFDEEGVALCLFGNQLL